MMSKVFTVLFPDIGEGVVEGEVVEWRKNPGDAIKQDEPVVVVMTDKATVELPAPHPGTLHKQYYPVGGIAIKDTPLYEILLEEGAKAAQAPAAVPESSAPPSPALKAPAQETAKKEPLTPSQTSERALATPKVRKQAEQMGIPLEEISGSGKQGRVTLEDLSQYKQPKEKAASIWQLPGDEELPLVGIKAKMAQKMVESKSRIPHFSYFEQAEATRLVQLRSNIKPQASLEGLHLTYMPFIIRAVSICIKKHPLLNSSLDAKHSKVVVHHRQNIGIAVATPLGLIVPVLKGVEEMRLEALIKAYEDLIKRAQGNKLSPADMKEATFTISNFGSTGAHGLWATPVINFPEAAILAIGKIHQQPLVRSGELVIRDVLNLSWSFDHRIIDGEAAAHISQTLCGLLENPAALL